MNLTTNQGGQDTKKDSVIKSGPMIIFILLLLVAGFCAGLLLWKKNLNDRTVAAEDLYKTKHTELTSGRNKDVIDFKNRISIIKTLVNRGPATLDALQNIEKNIVPGVYIAAYKNDKTTKMLDLKCVADNYDAVARQVLSLKSSSYFSEVIVKSIILSNEGKHDLLVTLRTN